MIRAVVFDYGNVIDDVDVRVFVEHVKPFMVGPMTPEERLLQTQPLSVQYESGKLDTAAFIPAFLKQAGLQMSHDEFIAAWSGFFRPIPFTHALIRSLSAKYRLGLLSNTNELHFEHLISRTDVFPLFETVTLSYRVGVMKPDPAIYRDTVRKLGLASSECLYIDDLKQNAEAAGALGMQTVHFTSPAEAAVQLKALLPDVVIPRLPE